MEASNAQNRPVADERSQHYELPDMSEAGGTASEAPHESAKVFTMLGNYNPPAYDSSNVP
jgi:hypothetical protein